MRAWLFKDYRQKQKLGDKAPWSVGWLDAEGRRRSKRVGTKKMAEQFRRLIEGQLTVNVYQSQVHQAFRDMLNEFIVRPLGEILTTALTEQRAREQISSNGKLAYNEKEAAALLGIKPSALRKARLAGHIRGIKIGRTVCYQRHALSRYLDKGHRQ